MNIGTFNGYKIYLSDKPNKKYYAIVDNRKVYFGGDPHIYEHYKDKLGYYSYLDHLDVKRRKKYQARFKYCKDNVGSACWFSYYLLWT